MFAQNPASGNFSFHRVGILIPYQGVEDDELVNFAGLRLAERFGLAGGVYDADTSAVLVFAVTFEELSELDMTVLMGIGIQVARQREGVAVIVDDDVIMM